MSEVITSNNFRRMSWLFTLEDVHLSSVYLRQEIRGEDRVGFVKGRVSEALRIADKISPKQQVLPYYWFKYQDNRHTFLSEVSPSEFVETFASDIVWCQEDLSKIYLHRKTRRTYLTRSPTSALTVWLFGVVLKIQIRNRNARTCYNMWEQFWDQR